MIYRYKCPEGHITENLQSIKDEIIQEVPCEECGVTAKKVFEIGGMIIPEHFKASSEENQDHGANTAYLSRRLKHSYPSGRQSKIYY